MLVAHIRGTHKQQQQLLLDRKTYFNEEVPGDEGHGEEAEMNKKVPLNAT